MSLLDSRGSAQFLRIGRDEDPIDAGRAERHHDGVPHSAVAVQQDSRFAVDQHEPVRVAGEGSAPLDPGEELRHPVGTAHGIARGTDLPAAVGAQCDVGGEHPQQFGHVAAAAGGEEAFRRTPVRGAVDAVARMVGVDVRPRPPRHLPHGARRAVHRAGDVPVRVIEDLAEDENGTFQWGQCLQHHQQRGGR